MIEIILILAAGCLVYYIDKDRKKCFSDGMTVGLEIGEQDTLDRLEQHNIIEVDHENNVVYPVKMVDKDT